MKMRASIPGPRAHLVAGALAVAGAAACGDSAGDPAPVFRDVALAIRDVPRPPDATLALGEAPSVAGTTADGALVVATNAGLFAVGADGLEPLPLFTEAPGVEAPAGAVVAIQPRADGGAWIVADNGLYRTEGRFHVGVDPSLTGVFAAFVTTNPPFDGLWLTTDDGLVQLSADAARTYDVPDAPAIRALDASADGEALMLVDGSGVRVLREGAEGLELAATTGPLEAPECLVQHGDRWWVGGASLYGADRPEARWDRSAVPAPVRSLGRGPDGALWWADDAGLYALASDEARRLYEGVVDQAAFAPNGDLWVVADDQALRFRAESLVPSFAQDVLPWLEDTGCVACHAAPALDFRRYDDFRSVASDALSRVESGDMPRCGNDLCPPDQQLAAGEYAVLREWIETGMNE